VDTQTTLTHSLPETNAMGPVINRSVLRELNRASHVLGQLHGETLRREFLAELGLAQAAGADPERLLELLADRVRQARARLDLGGDR
jgi:hypothetical protein